jgi:hypothetical protein
MWLMSDLSSAHFIPLTVKFTRRTKKLRANCIDLTLLVLRNGILNTLSDTLGLVSRSFREIATMCFGTVLKCLREDDSSDDKTRVTNPQFSEAAATFVTSDGNGGCMDEESRNNSFCHPPRQQFLPWLSYRSIRCAVMTKPFAFSVWHQYASQNPFLSQDISVNRFRSILTK